MLTRTRDCYLVRMESLSGPRLLSVGEYSTEPPPQYYQPALRGRWHLSYRDKRKHRRRQRWWRQCRRAAGNLDLCLAASAIDCHSRSCFLNGKMLPTARAVEADVHTRTVRVKRRAEDREFVGPLAPPNQNIRYVLRKAKTEVLGRGGAKHL